MKLNRIELHADTMVAAHAQLGDQLQKVIRRVAKARLRANSASKFEQQIRTTRRCREHLLDIAQQSDRAETLRQAIVEYLAALDAWSDAAGLEQCVPKNCAVDGQWVRGYELGLWLQDDNVGCQTGLLRRKDGSVLFWHTEEDTIGYFDHPRLITFHVKEQLWVSFLYPYLLPGPAFGWHAGKFHAIDSLDMRRTSDDRGCFTCVASWLAWRLGKTLDITEVIDALMPFVDGCAMNVIEVKAGQTIAATHELGRTRRVSRALATRSGSFSLQANMVAKEKCSLFKEEGLSRAERLKYVNRVERATNAVQQVRHEREMQPEDVIAMLSSRRGGNYANANEDVKAYCVGVASREGIEVSVHPGWAQPHHLYRPERIG